MEWLRGQLAGVPVVLVFESALELMGTTRLGSFEMDPSGALAGSSTLASPAQLGCRVLGACRLQQWHPGQVSGNVAVCSRCLPSPLALTGKSKGPPPAVKKVLSLFSSGREEDRMVGYLSFLKVGPKLLQFVPGNKVRLKRPYVVLCVVCCV